GTVSPVATPCGWTVSELHSKMATRQDLGLLFMGTLPDQTSQSEDLAAAVAWLASNEARHVTGIQLPVDLGRTNR
ncbi:MAG: SDR family mycofactocin-dependent oxidoreductase, partial [Gordonia sp. (in: high G+C Gram-positive bacteria)]